MIPNVEDMSTEDLSALLEALQSALASRQTRDAIVRDVTAVVDPIIRENRDLLGDGFVAGRVSWDGQCMTVVDPGDHEPEPEVETVSAPAVEPVAYTVGEEYPAGTVIAHDGGPLRVVKGHRASASWSPDSKPEWFEVVDGG